jgi:hypothetical protein
MGSNEITHRTSVAHIIQVGRDLLEVRYKPGILLDLAAVKEIHEVRLRLFGDQPYANISILPDDIEFDPAILKVDHYQESRPRDPLIAWAVVACGAVAEIVAREYFSRFPQDFPVFTCMEEAEARAWIKEQLNKRKAG